MRLITMGEFEILDLHDPDLMIKRRFSELGLFVYVLSGEKDITSMVMLPLERG